MSATKEKITRVQRLQSIEEGRLQALSVELAIAQSDLTKINAVTETVQSQIHAVTLPAGGHDVQSHQQSLAWIDHLESQLRELAELTVKAESVCETIRERMIQQKVKVNGWENLTDRMQADWANEIQATEMLEADDRYLNKPKTR